MANGHGGYRKPTNPAPVSGPGRHARRTDGGPAQVLSAAPNQGYGEAKAQLDAQRLAPMAGKQPMPSTAVPQGDQSAPTSMQQFAGPALDAPSQRTGEPITHGVDIGAGANSSIMNLPPPARGTGQMTALLTRFAASDPTGTLGPLLLKAQARNA